MSRRTSFDFDNTCKEIDMYQFPASEIYQSNKNGNFTNDQVLQALAPSIEGDIIVNNL